MRWTTRRTVLHGSAITLTSALGGCFGGDDSNERRSPDDGESATQSPTPRTESPTATEQPTASEPTTPTEVPPGMMNSVVDVRFGESPQLPGNGVEIHVREVGMPDSVRAYVRDDEGHVRWVEFFEDDARYAIYRNEYGDMVWSYSADAEMEDGGDSVMTDGLGWEPETSPERTVELYAVFEGEEHPFDQKRGSV